MTPSPAGQVQTVLGSISPEAMGITLPHEHLLIDFKVMFAEPAAASDKGRALGAGEPRQPRLGPPELQRQPRQPAPDRRAGRRATRSCSSSTRAAGPWSIRRRGRWRAIRSRWPASRAPPGSTSSWAPATTWPPRIPPTWTRRTRRRPRTRDDRRRHRRASATPACAPGCSARSARRAVDGERAEGSAGGGHRPARDGRAADDPPRAASRAPMEIAELVDKEGGDLKRTIMCHIDRTISRRAGGDRPGADGHLARVRPLRPRELLLPLQPELRHAERRRAHGAYPGADRGGPPRPGADVARHRLQDTRW